MVKVEKRNVVDSLGDTVLLIYDTVLKTYDRPLVCRFSEVKEILTAVVNDCSSKYYLEPHKFDVFQVGEFDFHTGSINLHPERTFLYNLGTFVEQRKRDVQTCIQTLNFLPTGYFKMPKEMQENIQEKIDNMVKFYVENFCDECKDLSKVPPLK